MRGSKRTISAHAGRGEKAEHPRNDPPLGDERSMKKSALVQSMPMRKRVRNRSLSD